MERSRGVGVGSALGGEVGTAVDHAASVATAGWSRSTLFNFEVVGQMPFI